MRRPFAYSLVAVLAAAGASLSGYLSYVNLWGSGCEKAAISCSASASGPVMILGLPNCVYGFAMFFVVFVLALIAIARENRNVQATILWLSVVGTLFAFGLSLYEISWLKASSLPACVYGFIFYVCILGLNILQRRTPHTSPVLSQ
ncbi:MAG: vitamin K epoxide reductase family protein [bacterium]|nr:vitamin K epoxide reductase family protein [bacterium]